MRSILMSGVGYPPHSVKLDTITCYARFTSKHSSNDRGLSTPGLGTPKLSQTQNYNVLRATYRKTSEQRQKVIYTRVGYPTHSVKLNTVTCYVGLAAKHPNNDEGHPHRGWVPSPLGQTQHCYVLRTTFYLKTSEQRRRVTQTGVGYSPPHSVKLNIVTRYVRLTEKHLSNNKRSSTRG